MPIFTLFFGLIIASLVSIILSTIFSVNGIAPEWVHHVFLSIIAASVVASIITKENICTLCSLVKTKSLKFCQCHHA